jgi:hypothetical protein
LSWNERIGPDLASKLAFAVDGRGRAILPIGALSTPHLLDRLVIAGDLPAADGSKRPGSGEDNSLGSGAYLKIERSHFWTLIDVWWPE